MVNLMKSDYSYPRDKSSYNPERTKVIRRTLSPIVKYETLYATKDMVSLLIHRGYLLIL